MTIKPLTPNPVEPANFSQALDALLTLGACLQRQGLVDASECSEVMGNIRDLSLEVLDHGEELYRQVPLNNYYRSLNLEGLNAFVDSLESAATARRKSIRKRLAWADELCMCHIGRKPFQKWYSSNEAVDEACRQDYLWIATGHDPAGPELLKYFFAPAT